MATAFAEGYAEGYSVAIQGDGKIVVAGRVINASVRDFAIARYNANGALDTTFGIGGKVTTDIEAGEDESFSVAIQTDGKIVVLGSTHHDSNADFGRVRYSETGTLDATFGTNGMVTTAIGTGSDGI